MFADPAVFAFAAGIIGLVVGSFLKGVGIEVLWPDLLALAAYTAALFCAGFLLFRKRPRA